MGTGASIDGVSKWLDEFFGNCTSVVEECDPTFIKYVALHDYTGNVTKLVSKVEGATNRYKRKILLTEWAMNKWACDCEPTRETMDAYMTSALAVLVASPALFRHAWYTGRDKPTAANGG